MKELENKEVVISELNIVKDNFQTLISKHGIISGIDLITKGGKVVPVIDFEIFTTAHP